VCALVFGAGTQVGVHKDDHAMKMIRHDQVLIEFHVASEVRLLLPPAMDHVASLGGEARVGHDLSEKAEPILETDRDEGCSWAGIVVSGKSEPLPSSSHAGTPFNTNHRRTRWEGKPPEG
jgi:hypothetical protein